MIVIFSNPRDVHARHIANLLRRRGREVLSCSRADFGNGASLSVRPDVNSGSLTIAGVRVACNDLSAIWHRRPGVAHAAAAITEECDRSFAESEWTHSLDGLFAVACRRNVSPPWKQRAATKPLQLSLAARLGLRVPRTLITSDPAEALSFIDACDGEVVHKAMTSPRHAFVDTRAWRPSDAGRLDDLPLCPTIFQERIAGPADVRVTVVGERMFSARIETSKGHADVDSRLDADAPCTPYELPNDVADGLRHLMSELGLVFGTVDLKIADDGGHAFLEINPQGQFMYVEIRTGMPISDAVADFLAGG